MSSIKYNNSQVILIKTSFFQDACESWNLCGNMTLTGTPGSFYGCCTSMNGKCVLESSAQLQMYVEAREWGEGEEGMSERCENGEAGLTRGRRAGMDTYSFFLPQFFLSFFLLVERQPWPQAGT